MHEEPEREDSRGDGPERDGPRRDDPHEDDGRGGAALGDGTPAGAPRDGSDVRSPESGPGDNPFPGLRPFRADEDYLFFGREAQTAELLRLLRVHRLLAVVGTSGSGKSSLVRAGLLPEVQGGAMAEAGSYWEIALLRPGGAPLTNLAQALCDADLYDAEDAENLPRVAATLRHSGRGLVEAYRQSDIEAETNLLVVVDQFEELFRFHGHDSDSRDEARAFVNLLLEASQQADVPIYVVLTMRSDYLGDCSQIRGLAEAVNAGEYLIPRLSREQLRAAIEGPVKVRSARMANRLVQNLLNDLGDDPDQLPVLQHALMRTWNAWRQQEDAGAEVDLSHYESIGGMATALSRHADEVYDSLPSDAHRAVAARMFMSLTEKGADNRGIRRPLSLEDLEGIVGSEAALVGAVVDAYRQPGVTFLMPGQPHSLQPDTVIDLSHESLMRVWERLRAWVEDEAQSARIYRRLAETARLWRDGRAGLYHDPDLQIAQSWREVSLPTNAWANLYAPGFDDAMEFLDVSRHAVVVEEEKREAARRRELAQAKELAESQARAAANFRRFSVGVAALALVAVGLAIWAFRLWDDSEGNRLAAVESAALAKSEASRAHAAESEALELRDRARHDHGKVFLERARILLEEKQHVAAKLTAARAVGFEGYGRAGRGEEFAAEYPVLLRADSAERTEVRELIESREEYPLLFQTPTRVWTRGVARAAYGPLGTHIAAADGDNTTAKLYVWRLEDGELVLEKNLPERVAAIVFDRNEEWLAVANLREIVLYNVDDGNVRLRIVTSDVVHDLGLAPDGSWIAAALGSGTVQKFLLPDGSELPASEESGQGAARLAVRSDGAVAAGWNSGRLTVWDAEGERLNALQAHSGAVIALEFHPSGSHLLTCGADNAVKVWPTDRNGVAEAPESSWEGIQRTPRSVSFHPAKPLVAVAGGPGRLSLRRFPTGELVSRMRAERGVITNVAFSPDGSKLLATSANKTRNVQIWDVVALEELTPRPDGFSATASSVDISADGQWMLACGRDRTLRLWGLATGEEVWRHDFEDVYAWWVRFRPDGSQFLATEEQGTHVFDLESRKPVVFIPAPGSVTVAEWSPDGNSIAMASERSGVGLWDAASRSLRYELPSSSAAVWAVSFSEDGSQLAAADESGAVRVWNVADGSLRFEIPHYSGSGLRDAAWALALSPDARRVAVGGTEGRVALWDLTGEAPSVLARFEGHERSLRYLEFSHDGTILASGGDDGAARLWDMTDHSLRAVLTGHSGGILSLRFAPDGRSLASSSRDGTVRLWGIDRRGDASLEFPGLQLTGAAFVDNRRIVSGGPTGVQIIDRWTGDVRGVASGWRIISAIASPDGRYVASGRRNAIVLQELETGVEVTRYEYNVQSNPGKAFSSDSRYFAVPLGTQVIVRDLPAGEDVRLTMPEDVWATTFDPDGNLYTADAAGAITLLASGTWDQLRRMEASTTTLTRVDVSADGVLVAAGGYDGKVRIWSGVDWKLQHELPVGADRNWVDVAFSPNGALLAVAVFPSGQGQIKLFDTATGKLVTAHSTGVERLFDVAFSPDGTEVCGGGFGSRIGILDVAMRRDASRLVTQLDFLRVNGRQVLPRPVTNLYGERSLALQPWPGSHLQILSEVSDDAERVRRLFWHYLRVRNHRSAELMLRAQDEASRERKALDGFVDLCLSRAKRSAELGASSAALEAIERAQRWSGGSPRFAAAQARVLRILGRTEEAERILAEAITAAESQGDAPAELAELLRRRSQARVEQGDWESARDDLSRLLGVLRDPRSYPAELRRHGDEVVNVIVGRGLEGTADREILQAIALGAVLYSTPSDRKIPLERIPALSVLVERASRSRVSTAILERESQWSYWDAVDAPPADWHSPGFEPGGWKSGPGSFGFGDSRESTKFTAGRISYYLRREFELSSESLAPGVGLRLSYARDDGLVIYVNGREVHRDNMPPGEIFHATQAVETISSRNETLLRHVSLPRSVVRPGRNAIAVSVHQDRPSSSDVHFELSLLSTVTSASYLASLTEEEVAASLDAATRVFPAAIIDGLREALTFCFMAEAAPGSSESVDLWERRADVQRSLGRLDGGIAALERAISLLSDDEAGGDRFELSLERVRLEKKLRPRLTEAGRVAEATERERRWMTAELEARGVVRINCGGGELLTPSGNLWREDGFHTPGFEFSSGGRLYSAEIPDTDADPVYQTERVFRPPGEGNGSYSVPVPSGRYRVRLHFAEIYLENGGRAFSVRLGDDTVLEDYDPHEAAGGFGKPDIKEFPVQITDGTLRIQLLAQEDWPKISGIEILKAE